MAHELEIQSNGNAAVFLVSEPGWHRLGTVLDSPPSIEAGLKAAGLDWTVYCENIYTKDGIKLSTKAVRRSTDGRVLGEVGPNWTPLQNHEAFEWFAPFLDSGEASLETAGALYSGSRVWVQAKINREPSVIVKKCNDEVDKYILLSNGHDGKLAVRVGFVPIRVVCANTMAMAHDNKASKLLRVRHKANVKKSLDEIREIMNIADRQFEATAEQLRELARHQINEKDLVKYIREVFKTPKKNDEEEEVEETDSAPKRKVQEDDARKIENKILPLFEGAIGNDMPGVRGTVYAAYNSLSFFLTHMRGRTVDSRLDSLWFGSSNALNKKALDLALQMVK